jgi:hypothetical protein
MLHLLIYDSNKKWVIGNLDENLNFTKIREIKSKRHYNGEIITLSAYNAQNREHESVLDKNKIVENINTNVIFVLPGSFEKEWENNYWKYYNKKCMICEKECKQSVYNFIVHCPSYKQKETNAI